MARCLIVDPDAPEARRLAAALSEAGDTVDVSQDAVRALELIHAGRFDVVITALALPGMSAGQLLCAIRRLDPGVAIVTVSGPLAPAEREVVGAFGVLAAVEKPAELSAVVAWVRAARRDGLVALVEDDGPAAVRVIEALQASGFATVHVRSPEQVAHLRPKELLAAIVDLAQPEAMIQFAQRHPALPQIVTGAAPPALPITPWLHLTRPAKLGLLLTALNQLHRRR